MTRQKLPRAPERADRTPLANESAEKLKAVRALLQLGAARASARPGKVRKERAASTEKLTKQGVRDLHLGGHNGHRNAGTACRHNFEGAFVVIGHRWAIDDDDWSGAYQEEILGKRCIWCGATREVP